MAGLSDMEELLSSIKKREVLDYMKEALGCYHAGAYRGAIVLSYISLFEDLGLKLHELAATNSVAKTISIEVRKRQNEHAIFESYMVDQLKAANLISESEATTLDQIRVCRNKAAHPSGMQPSAEEARYVFYEVISKFLSKPLLQTKQAADAILLRLGNENFFPTRKLDEVAAIIKDELSILHEEAHAYLISKVVESGCQGNEHLNVNSRRFLIGLAYTNDAALVEQIKKRLIKLKADDRRYGDVIFGVGAANPNTLTGHDQPTIMRLRNLFAQVVVESAEDMAITRLQHPVRFLKSLLQILGEEKCLELFEEVSNEIVQKYPYTSTLVEQLAETKKLKKRWLKKIKRDSSSNSFDVANYAATNIPNIDDALVNTVKPKEALDILLSISKAADHGAFTSQDLRKSGFESIPNLKRKAVEFIKGNESEAQEMIASAIDSSVKDFLKSLR